MVSAALVAVTAQLPVPVVIASCPALMAHAVDVPTAKLSAPVPLPPLVVMASRSPKVPLSGPITVNVAQKDRADAPFGALSQFFDRAPHRIVSQNIPAGF